MKDKDYVFRGPIPMIDAAHSDEYYENAKRGTMKLVDESKILMKVKEYEKDWRRKIFQIYLPREIQEKLYNGDWPLSSKLRYEDSDIWGVK